MTKTKSEALASIAQTVMRARDSGIGLKHPAQAEIIIRTVLECSGLVAASDDDREAATTELFRRYNIRGAA